ncbi:hypothetical protein [Magnetospirillum sp. UT-4]|uniref:hypothetical protein n=1 Tax=Magnetospirillum sp. UT-4 TaxID=2681467 RepID=UPI0013835FC6|nr:hypothetical protein [Magnetospirillum sp. UT-4]CAA7622519.1 conserved exported hypothetical protein [Magnetospirillum sp. UT-4]
MKAIKALVAVMSTLLLAGIGLLVYGFYTKATQMGAKPAPMAQAVPAATASFGEVTVALPAGAKVDQVLAAGDRLVVRLGGPGPVRLLVFDPVTGSATGSFVLAPAAAR